MTASRQFPSWLDEFVRLTDHANSPAPFRWWAGMTAISSALQRKVWLRVQNRQLFPNLFVFLIGPPGGGKTTALRYARDLLIEIHSVKLSPSKITPEQFINNLCKCKSVEIGDAGMYLHSSYSAYIEEGGVFIKFKDFDFMTILTELFDCGRIFTYETRHREAERAENVHVNLLICMTPQTFAKNIGSEAFGLGFTSRLLLIYSEEEMKKPLNLSSPNCVEQPPLATGLDPSMLPILEDLRRIHKISGEYLCTPDAAKEFESWYSSGMKPLPSDSRFAEYNARRHIHWLKMSLLIAASKRDERIITLEDLNDARERLIETEVEMPLALEAVGSNPLADALSTIHKWMLIEFMTKHKNPIPENAVRRQLMREIPIQYHQAAIDALAGSNLVQIVIGSEEPNRLFVPQPRRQ